MIHSLLKARVWAVTVEVPASSANLGPGFDVLSVALRRPRMKITLERTLTAKRMITNRGEYGTLTTSNSQHHAGARALSALYEKFGIKDGYVLTNFVDIPPRKGLGLSGAEAAGVVIAANQIYNLKFTPIDIVTLASKGEPSGHLDNVSASVNGGFNIVVHENPADGADVLSLSPPDDLGVALVIPNAEKKSTEEARRAVPSSVAISDSVHVASRVAAITAGFATRDIDLILSNLSWDPVVEGSRARAGIYGENVTEHALLEEKKFLLKNFHVAETISGAGPTRALWFNASKERKERRRIGRTSLQRAVDHVIKSFENYGYSVVKTIVTRPAVRGARIVKIE